MILEKDLNTLASVPNAATLDGYQRVLFENASDSMVKALTSQQGAIKALIIVVSDHDSVSEAAKYRNSNKNIFFIFPVSFKAPVYFRDTSKLIAYPKALINRIEKGASNG